MSLQRGLTFFGSSALAACFAVGALVASPAVAAPAEPPVPAKAEAGIPLADLRVELRAGESEPLSFIGRKIEIEGNTELVVLEEEHEHRLQARLTAADEKQVTVTLRYVRDGETVFDGLALRLALGGPATTRAVGQTAVQAKVSPGGRRLPKIEMPDGDNPLDGL